MPLTSHNSALHPAAAPRPAPPFGEENAYATRLREVENVLLCQALGGQLAQPDSPQRLQRYLDGEISRAEAFQPLGYAAGRWAN